MLRIEVTYLCNELPGDLKKCKSENIEQGYLCDEDDPVRIRNKGGLYSFTRKTMANPDDLSFRDYSSIDVYKEEFDKVWKIVTKKLKKTRYYYSEEMDGPDIRVDVFEGELKGLILVELVFTNEGDLRTYEVPKWFGPEVTKDRSLTNPAVAGKTFSEIKPILEKHLNAQN